MNILNTIRKIHGDKYSLHKFMYRSYRDKVCLICNKHGEFNILLSNLIGNNRGCPNCGLDNKLTKTRSNTEEFIIKARKIHGDKYDYTKSNYVNWKTKLTVLCPVHGEFEIRPNNHLNKQGCKVCKSDNRQIERIRKESENINIKSENISKKLNNRINKFINKSNKIHNYKYDYTKSIEDILSCGKMSIKVDILCNKHGFFQQTTSHHSNGNGCPLCYHESKTGNNRMNKATAIHNCNKTHNYYYNYDEVVFNNITDKVNVVCPKHGSFKISLSRHMRGSGCKKCNKKEPNYKYNTNQYLSLLNDNVNYDYSKTSYNGMRNKISVLCNKHGEFYVAAHHHLRGSGCRQCGIDNKSRTKSEFIKESKEIHNGKYEYDIIDDVIKTSQKISIICKEHGVFKQTSETHLRGSGCGLCHTKSRGEIYIKSFLEENNIEYIREMSILIDNKRYRYDFYLKDRDICIEYDGKHHFEPIEYFGGQETFNKVVKSDNIKNKYCVDNNIDLMRIKYTDIKNINILLKNKLLNVKLKTK